MGGGGVWQNPSSALQEALGRRVGGLGGWVGGEASRSCRCFPMYVPLHPLAGMARGGDAAPNAPPPDRWGGGG